MNNPMQTNESDPVIDIIEHLDFCRGSAVAIPRTLATTTKDPAITAWVQSNINDTKEN